MTPLVRYLVADVLRGQRWAAPLLAYLSILMIIGPPTGPVLPTYAMASAALVPIGMWITIVVMHNEEPMQAAITMSVNGGFRRVWLAKVGAALLCTSVLGLAALIWLTATSVQFAQVGLGALDFAMTVLAGVAFGTVISRPVLPKLGWTIVLGVGICFAQLFVRHAPPVNALIDLYAGDRPGSTGTLLLIAAESVVLSVLVIVAAHALARRRV
ncbi:hypothetical protein [Kibdelosporangium phytohabitans]|uniref:ABC transporter n=1 Tax=Kibdelosporangium phytohabitans TaxID=860235 RepID=A0A0N9ICU2_9PSEU|nr:hypothetical protein [Kibdelosporangium phytohabitans]ALG14232.1 hypothetical protein AOZ06_51755 [Kibdelosporangium phytohabitans]MBE1466768.1 hypothetical protein [Kibdelosporangium phytohabitans]